VKNLGLVLLFVVVAGALIGVVAHYKQQVTQISKVLESERYSRLVAEEKVVNSVSKIKQLQDDLSENEDKIAKIQNILKEQNSVNKDLESQYQKLSKSKSQLEDQIQMLISQQAMAAQAESAVQEVVQRNETVQQNEAESSTH
jgi:TolA-binding protein